jgi:hypothetical protein
MIPFFYKRSDESLALKCPECGGFYLQLKKVEVFDVDEEDKNDEGLHVSIDHEVASVDRNLSNAQGEKRHGIVIQFVCGECAKRSAFKITQNNGNALVDFSVFGELR